MTQCLDLLEIAVVELGFVDIVYIGFQFFRRCQVCG